ncbi:hypothetical protein E2F47_01870 [Mycobacterium eburneum]|nr:hypothetical protein [Mycobacterium eburneum]TDH57540.1 hypothetical protein E2F47_01870 [Mycobacterium eburneum]
MSVADPPLLGRQTPRILWAPPAPTSAADEAIELAADCGLILDPWQQLSLHHALGERPDGKWSAFEVGLCVPRQNGKSAIIEARILAGLLLFGEELITYSAHEFRTAMEIMRRLERLLIASGEKFMPTTSHGQEGFEMGTVKRQGQRVLFQSRTKAAGLGTSGDCIILDEAMWLAPEAIGVLMPTMAARPNPQLWYAGSSVDQEMHPKGHVFSGVRKRGMERSSPRLCYIEWSPDDGDDRADPKVWAKANPAMGLRPGFTVEYVADEFDAMRHTPKMFDVMRLGIGDWPTLADTLLPPIDGETWTGLTDTSPELAGPYPRVIAIDRAPLSKVWSIAGAQRRQDGRAQVEIGFNAKASPTEVIEKLLTIVTEADPAALIIDARSPAAFLKPQLIEAGIEPEMTNLSELAIACEGFLESSLAGQIRHSGQQILTESVAGAVKRDLPGGRFVWEGQPGACITQIMAATLAHYGLLTFGGPVKPAPPPMAAKQEMSLVGAEREFDPLNAPF